MLRYLDFEDDILYYCSKQKLKMIELEKKVGKCFTRFEELRGFL